MYKNWKFTFGDIKRYSSLCDRVLQKESFTNFSKKFSSPADHSAKYFMAK